MTETTKELRRKIHQTAEEIAQIEIDLKDNEKKEKDFYTFFQRNERFYMELQEYYKESDLHYTLEQQEIELKLQKHKIFESIEEKKLYLQQEKKRCRQIEDALYYQINCRSSRSEVNKDGN